MTREEGERWIVDLVRDARLDAKIDLKQVSHNIYVQLPRRLVLIVWLLFAEHRSNESRRYTCLPICYREVSRSSLPFAGYRISY